MAKRGRKPKQATAQETPIAGGLRSVKEKRNLLKEKTEAELRREIDEAKPSQVKNLADEIKKVADKVDYSREVSNLKAAIESALEPIVERLERTMFLAARVAASDTLRTGQSPEVIFKRALDEGRLAAAILSAQNEVKEVKPCSQT